MPRLTNESNLPGALVRAIMSDDYDKGPADFSATGLLKPPQQRRLLQTYAGHPELVEDAQDRIWALLGKAVHKILEEHGSEDHIIEERLFREIDVDGEKYVVSGAMDVQQDQATGVWKINDWKVTSVGTLMYGEQPKPDWVAQLNIYEWLRGEPTELQITAILRDFKKSQVGKTWRGAKRPHPDSPAQVVPIPNWGMERTEGFIRQRIRDHVADPVRYCTEEEIWGGTRCKDWCPVNIFCPQFNRPVEVRISVDDDEVEG